MVVKRYLISGRVQGVGFRFFVLREAQDLGLCGWVRNLRDGRVEALVDGSIEEQARIEEILRQGPRWSEVEAIRVTDHPDQPVVDGFEIRRDGG